jgi:hypothetical protein
LTKAAAPSRWDFLTNHAHVMLYVGRFVMVILEKNGLVLRGAEIAF